jgi:hypothetical protein
MARMGGVWLPSTVAPPEGRRPNTTFPFATTDSGTPRGKRGGTSQSRGLSGTAGEGSFRTTQTGGCARLATALRTTGVGVDQAGPLWTTDWTEQGKT